jgi:hypothetical protein
LFPDTLFSINCYQIEAIAYWGLNKLLCSAVDKTTLPVDIILVSDLSFPAVLNGGNKDIEGWKRGNRKGVSGNEHRDHGVIPAVAFTLEDVFCYHY